MPGLVPGHPRLNLGCAKTSMAGAGSGHDELLSFPEQRGKALLALAGELHDTAAGFAICGSPFQLGEAPHQRRTQRARQMMTPLAPVEAGLADRAARMGERLRID